MPDDQTKPSVEQMEDAIDIALYGILTEGQKVQTPKGNIETVSPPPAAIQAAIRRTEQIRKLTPDASGVKNQRHEAIRRIVA